MRGIFVTGTDTGVGKTVISAALMHRLRPLVPVCYWKPVQTGAPEDDDTAVVTSLGACSDTEICAAGIRLPRPLSPHLSAQLSGVRIDVASIKRLAGDTSANYWIVEGAGGVLVPLNEKELMVDLIVALRLPALVISHSRLGTINHTLLTLGALRAQAIPVVGVVLTGEHNPENRKAIEKYGEVEVVGEMPPFPSLDSITIANWARGNLRIAP